MRMNLKNSVNPNKLFGPKPLFGPKKGKFMFIRNPDKVDEVSGLLWFTFLGCNWVGVCQKMFDVGLRSSTLDSPDA